MQFTVTQGAERGHSEETEKHVVFWYCFLAWQGSSAYCHAHLLFKDLRDSFKWKLVQLLVIITFFLTWKQWIGSQQLVNDKKLKDSVKAWLNQQVVEFLQVYSKLIHWYDKCLIVAGIYVIKEVLVLTLISV